MAVTRSHGIRRLGPTRARRAASIQSATQAEPGEDQVAPAPETPATKRRRRRAGADPWTIRRKRRPATATATDAKRRSLQVTHYTCRICTEEQPIENFVKWVPPNRRRKKVLEDAPYDCIDHLCRRPVSKSQPVCKTCLGNNMRSKIERLGARSLTVGCLEPNCSSYWSFEMIMKYIPADALEAYNMGMFNDWKHGVLIFTCTATIQDGESGEERTCGAEGLVEAMTPGYPQVSCTECKTRMCFSCKIPWHKGYTCAEYAARHVNAMMTDPEKTTLKFMQKKNAKRCPNCFLIIEKDGGCNSMYCEGCKTYFDWGTAASAVPGAKNAPPVVDMYGNQLNRGCELDEIEGGEDQQAAEDQATPVLRRSRRNVIRTTA